MDNGIHELILQQPDRHGVDDLVEYIYRVMESTPESEPTRYLMDNSCVTAPPLTYLANRIREVDRNRSATRAPGAVAVLYDGMMGEIANTLLLVAMKNQIHFFKPSQRDKAIEWLLTE